MSDRSPVPKRKRPLGYLPMLGLTVLLGLAVGSAMALIEAFGGAATTPLLGALVIGATAVAMWICVRWWRGVDEAVREAHKWAWYWGGSAGIGVIMLLFVLSSWDIIVLTLKPFDDGPNGLVLTGVAITLAAQLAGYLVAWAAWWARHR